MRVLSTAMAALVPKNARVLDVGCGDGLISNADSAWKADITVEGIDVLLRPKAHIPVSQFDGTHLPYVDGIFDTVMFVDVLHYTEDPSVLLREATRVSKNVVLIKDHVRDGFLAGPTLHFMDWMGNARHGVIIPANYGPQNRGYDAFAQMGLMVNYWTKDVPLYPRWVAWVFGRSLHFIVRLAKHRS